MLVALEVMLVKADGSSSKEVVNELDWSGGKAAED